MDSLICIFLVALGVIFERADILLIAALFSLSSSIYSLRNITITHKYIEKNSPRENNGDGLSNT